MNHSALAPAQAVLNKSSVPRYRARHTPPATLYLWEPKRRTGANGASPGARHCALVPGTAPRCPGGSVSKGLVPCEVLGCWSLISGHCCNLLCPISLGPAPPSATCRAPWVRRAGQSRTGQGIIITPNTGLETELSPAFLSASQALC